MATTANREIIQAKVISDYSGVLKKDPLANMLMIGTRKMDTPYYFFIGEIVDGYYSDDKKTFLVLRKNTELPIPSENVEKKVTTYPDLVNNPSSETKTDISKELSITNTATAKTDNLSPVLANPTLKKIGFGLLLATGAYFVYRGFKK